jgi:hypothetical protein
LIPFPLSPALSPGKGRDPQTAPRQEQGEASAASTQQGLGDEVERALRLGTGQVVEEVTGILEEIERAAVLLGEILAESGADRRRLVQEQA